MRLSFIGLLLLGTAFFLALANETTAVTCNSNHDCSTGEPYCYGSYFGGQGWSGVCGAVCEGDNCCNRDSDCHYSRPFCTGGFCSMCEYGTIEGDEQCMNDWNLPCGICQWTPFPDGYTCVPRPAMDDYVCDTRWVCKDACHQQQEVKECNGASVQCTGVWEPDWSQNHAAPQNGRICKSTVNGPNWQSGWVDACDLSTWPNNLNRYQGCNVIQNDFCQGGNVVEIREACTTNLMYWNLGCFDNFVPVTCTVQTCGAGQTCPAGGNACVAATCNAGNVGTACAGDSWDSANYYCSTGIADGPGAGNCCPDGTWWNGVSCINTDECFNVPCPYAPGTANWFATASCVSGGQACCSINGGKYGQSPYYDYQNIVVYS